MTEIVQALFNAPCSWRKTVSLSWVSRLLRKGLHKGISDCPFIVTKTQGADAIVISAYR